MDQRIEISVMPQWRDSRGEATLRGVKNILKVELESVRTRDVFTVSAEIDKAQAEKIAKELSNPVTQSWTLGESKPGQPFDFDFLIAVGFKPGVTDNVGRTARVAVGDIIGRKLREDEAVYSSVEYMIKGKGLSKEKALAIGRDLLANELIETVSAFSREELVAGSVPLNKPVVKGAAGGKVEEFDLEVSDEALMEISRKGTLALSLEEMKAIQGYSAPRRAVKLSASNSAPPTSSWKSWLRPGPNTASTRSSTPKSNTSTRPPARRARSSPSSRATSRRAPPRSRSGSTGSSPSSTTTPA
jgi:phosphoribosylformylglycinamidine synthase